MSSGEILILEFVACYLFWGVVRMVAPRLMHRLDNAILLRRFRLAAINGYVAFGDKTVQIATIVPQFRRRLWENWRRPRLLRRASLIESRIG